MNDEVETDSGDDREEIFINNLNEEEIKINE